MQMLGFMTGSIKTHKITCLNYNSPLEYGDDGYAIDTAAEEFKVMANIQPANAKDVDFVTASGGYTESERFYTVRFNEPGRQVYAERFLFRPDSFSAGNDDTYCDDEDVFCQGTLSNDKRAEVAASRIIAVIDGFTATLRVIYSDNRDHRVACKAIAVMEGIR